MPRHSKNNTALGFFTYEEKKKLNYGTQKQRLGRESMKDYDVCYLCLQPAINAMSCTRGHISCKECIFANILTQKSSISKNKKDLELQNKQIEDKQKLKSDLDQISKLSNFEKTQTSITNSKELEMKGKGKVHPFFLNSVNTDKVEKTINSLEKDQPQCQASEPHSISLKKLFPLKFIPINGQENSAESGTKHMCPSCQKNLRKGMKLTAIKECGHVFCSPCSKQFIETGLSCTHCNTQLTKKDFLPLQTDGTGFAAGGGQVEAQKYDVAFQ